MRLVACLGFLLSLAAGACGQPIAPAAWQTFYADGHWDPYATAWLGEGTSSQRTPEGLLIDDSSAGEGSGRFYMTNWHADPAQGAALEARVKVLSCVGDWGVSMMVSDGVHEEALTLFPDRVQIHNARESFPLDTTSGFHDYRFEIRARDVRLFVDGTLTWDGAGRFTSPAASKPPRNQAGFGAGASGARGKAVWQAVRYRSGAGGGATPAPAVAGDLRITIGQTVEIVPGATYCGLFKYRDGRLAVGGRISSDQGRTWQAAAGPGVAAFEFPDGEIISPGFTTDRIADGVFEVALTRSTDGGRTFTRERARLSIPEGTGGTGDDGKYYPGPPVDHAIVQLRDGSLLMAMYGYFKSDTVLCPAFPPEWKVYKYRTWVMRSTDRGKTWDLRATVAYDPAVGAESFCEADLLALPGGDLLCFMRTGGTPPKYMTPLYCSRSSDDGLTWSKPVPIADRGVWPNSCRMQDGTLVVTYGRPDNWLAFSRDQGRTWAGHLCFYRGVTTSYNSVEEVAPGRLLVVYDRAALDANGNLARGLVGTFLEVAR